MTDEQPTENRFSLAARVFYYGLVGTAAMIEYAHYLAVFVGLGFLAYIAYDNWPKFVEYVTVGGILISIVTALAVLIAVLGYIAVQFGLYETPERNERELSERE